ncbi:MAG: IMPACT family protein [Candidatus Cryptobacteroides sp.]
MNIVSDEYYSIEAPVQAVYKEQKSRFLAFAYPVESEEEVKELLAKCRNEYHDARHHCLAYRIGHDGAKWRASDDGEPSGTAGRPILGQIDSAGLSDVAVIVVRYFGGIKLGVPGLIAAYKEASRAALEAAVRLKKTAGHNYALSFGYDAMPEVMKVLKEMSLAYKDLSFEDECSLKVRIRLSSEKEFFERTNKITNFKYYIL